MLSILSWSSCDNASAYSKTGCAESGRDYGPAPRVEHQALPKGWAFESQEVGDPQHHGAFGGCLARMSAYGYSPAYWYAVAPESRPVPVQEPELALALVLRLQCQPVRPRGAELEPPETVERLSTRVGVTSEADIAAA